MTLNGTVRSKLKNNCNHEAPALRFLEAGSHYNVSKILLELISFQSLYTIGKVGCLGWPGIFLICIR